VVPDGTKCAHTEKQRKGNGFHLPAAIPAFPVHSTPGLFRTGFARKRCFEKQLVFPFMDAMQEVSNRARIRGIEKFPL
jgi:hypothetical protein